MISRLVLITILFGLATACDNKPVSTKEQKDEINDVKTSDNEDRREKTKKILFFGDSLTAGLGVDEEDSYPSLIQNRIDSLSLPYEVINAGLSGETTAAGKGRIEWVMNQPVDVFVLELGANDMLRGLDIVETEKNLRAILDAVKNKDPQTNIIIAGMEAPPNMGSDYTSKFKNIFSDLAKDYNAGLIPFLLEGLADKPELNIGDGKHPNAEGYQIVLENVWKVLENYL